MDFADSSPNCFWIDVTTKTFWMGFTSATKATKHARKRLKFINKTVRIYNMGCWQSRDKCKQKQTI